MFSPVVVMSAVAFLAGAAVGETFGHLVAGVFVACGAAVLWWYRRATLWFCVACLGLGSAWAASRAACRFILHEDIGPARLHLRVETAAEPVLREAPWMVADPTPDRQRMLARVMQTGDPLPTGVVVQLSAPREFKSLPGQCFEMAGELTAWPEKDFADGLDVRAIKRRRGIAGLLTLRAAELAEPVACEPPTWRERLRRLQRERADALVAQGAGATAVAIVLGDRRGLLLDRTDAYAAAGFTHVLSVSGLHVSACAMAVFSLLRVLFGALRLVVRLPARALAQAGTLPAIAFYVMLTGAEVPAVRSALMVACVLLVKRTSGWLALGSSAWLILIAAPESSVEPSFLFSFVSVAAMLLSRRWPGTAANIASWPLSIAFFQQFSWIGLVTNWVAVPLSSFGIVLPGLLWLSLPLPFLAQWLSLAGSALDWLAQVTSFGAIDVAIPFAGLLYLLVRRTKLTVTIAAAVLLHALPWQRFFSSDAELHVLPVGQGDGMVLFANFHVAVIDTGGDPQGRVDPGRRVLRPFLLAHGVRRIDCLIITHQHPDHFGGAHDVLRHFQVRRTITNRDAFDCPEFPFESLREHFEEFGENDNSIVLKLRHKAHTLLLTGDAEALAEDELDDVASDVLKIGHHGSHTSTGERFLAKVRPRIALISCGKHNHFGHPHAEVLERLHAAGIAVFRTDIQGHLAVTLGDVLSVRPFRL